jgi:hypothetical protein
MIPKVTRFFTWAFCAFDADLSIDFEIRALFSDICALCADVCDSVRVTPENIFSGSESAEDSLLIALALRVPPKTSFAVFHVASCVTAMLSDLPDARDDAGGW